MNHKYIQQLTIRILKEHIRVDDEGNVTVRNPDRILKIIDRAKKNDPSVEGFFDQDVKGFKRKMPYNNHEITCIICKKQVVVRAIGKRAPRTVCYDKDCTKKFNRMNVKKSRGKNKDSDNK